MAVSTDKFATGLAILIERPPPTIELAGEIVSMSHA
jgi:hypothetical protein